MKILSSSCHISNALTSLMNFLSHFVLLGIRLYLAYTFMWSGWVKVKDWSSTLMLFQYEYKVPVISPETAAWIGTGAELILPIFLILGFGARLPAIALFIFNVVMVISYPILLTSEGVCMLKDHILWSALIGYIIFFGSGKISLDYLLQKKVCPNYKI